jgi:hypothetical protein
MMNDLVEKYNYFIENFPFKNKFYHLISVKNFIDNFDKIKNEKDKEEIFSLLNEYMDYITLNDVESNRHCRSLYYEFIEPLGRIYSRNMEFKFLIPPSTIILLTVILNLICLYFHTIYIVFIFIFLIGSYSFLLVLKMRKRDNVYSYNF